MFPSLSLPSSDCRICQRLAEFRDTNREKFPDWHNGAVTPFGSLDSQLLIVGLAPGLRGANRTGRPFTGDYAGNLLFDTLGKFNFARGTYSSHANDGVQSSISPIKICIGAVVKSKLSGIATNGG